MSMLAPKGIITLHSVLLIWSPLDPAAVSVMDTICGKQFLISMVAFSSIKPAAISLVKTACEGRDKVPPSIEIVENLVPAYAVIL